MRVSGRHPLVRSDTRGATPVKRCRKCGELKPLDDFPRHRGSKDGRRSRCKPCHSADVRAWTQSKPDRVQMVRARVRAWRSSNPDRYRASQRRRKRERLASDPEFRERCREIDRRSRGKHRTKRVAAHRRWVAANPDRAKARNRRWAERHREKTRAKVKAWQIANPEKAKALKRAVKATRRARERGAPGVTTRQQLQARWEYYAGRCWLCGREANSLDHVIALAQGGSNWPANLRPACLACNVRKGASRALPRGAAGNPMVTVPFFPTEVWAKRTVSEPGRPGGAAP